MNNDPFVAEHAFQDPKRTGRWWTLSRSTRIDLVLGAIFFLTAALYALLMIRSRVPPIGLIGVVVLWLAYVFLGGRLSFATPMDLPVLGLLGLLPLTLVISIDWNLSLPKIYGLVLGIILFYLVVNLVRNYPRLKFAILALILLAVGTAALGLLTADWSEGLFDSLTRIQHKLIRILRLPSQFAEASDANVNTIGGALTFFVPLLGSLFWDDGGFYRKYLRRNRHRQFLKIVYKVLLGGALLFTLGILILTGSRAAYLGCAVGMFLMAILKERRITWQILLIFLVALSLAVIVLGKGDPFAFIPILTDRGEITLDQRVHLWQESIGIIQDFPLTGGGIFTMGRLLSESYVFSFFPGAEEHYMHAHNLLLTVAFDLGVPGLVLYTALLGSFGAMAFHNFDVGRSIVRALVVGLASGMAAHHVFGLLDANVLGTKLGAILWIFLGLMAAIYVHRDNLHWRISSRKRPQPGKRIPRLGPALFKKRLLDLLIGLAYWLVISLVAVIFITDSPILSLMVATLGGILLGVVLTKRFVLRNTKNKKNKLNHEGLEEEEERNKPRRTQRAQS